MITRPRRAIAVAAGATVLALAVACTNPTAPAREDGWGQRVAPKANPNGLVWGQHVNPNNEWQVKPNNEWE